VSLKNPLLTKELAMKPCASCPSPAKCMKAGKCMKKAKPKAKAKPKRGGMKRGY
jgi:hypothetical protein